MICENLNYLRVETRAIFYRESTIYVNANSTKYIYRAAEALL